MRACRQFKKDPNAFAEKLFKDVSKSSSPTFSVEEAEKYFSALYRDKDRGDGFSALPEMVRPPAPTQIFDTSCPTLADLRRHTTCKCNGAAAGLNSLTYVPYKRCPIILVFLHKIIKKIWKSRASPEAGL